MASGEPAIATWGRCRSGELGAPLAGSDPAHLLGELPAVALLVQRGVLAQPSGLVLQR